MTIVGVAWSGDDPAFQGFVDKYKLTFPTLSDPDGLVFSHFGVSAQPAWVFLKSDGSGQRHQGALEPDALIDELTKLTT